MQYPNLSALRELITELRGSENGCAWTRDQDPSTLISKTIEEVYELQEAILKENWQGIKEELGDLLYHIVFYTEVARENGQFDFDDLADIMLQKNQQRMPSFEARKQMTAEETNEHWQKSKAKKFDKNDPFSKISPYLPALQNAFQTQERAAEFGFDWSHPKDVIAKIREELLEIEAEIDAKDQNAVINECGDLLFAAINLARKCGGHPETALAGCNLRFRERFTKMDQIIQSRNATWGDYSLQELEDLWQSVKAAIS